MSCGEFFDLRPLPSRVKDELYRYADVFESELDKLFGEYSAGMLEVDKYGRYSHPVSIEGIRGMPYIFGGEIDRRYSWVHRYITEALYLSDMCKRVYGLTKSNSTSMVVSQTGLIFHSHHENAPRETELSPPTVESLVGNRSAYFALIATSKARFTCYKRNFVLRPLEGVLISGDKVRSTQVLKGNCFVAGFCWVNQKTSKGLNVGSSSGIPGKKLLLASSPFLDDGERLAFAGKVQVASVVNPDKVGRMERNQERGGKGKVERRESSVRLSCPHCYRGLDGTLEPIEGEWGGRDTSKAQVEVCREQGSVEAQSFLRRIWAGVIWIFFPLLYLAKAFRRSCERRQRALVGVLTQPRNFVFDVEDVYLGDREIEAWVDVGRRGGEWELASLAQAGFVWRFFRELLSWIGLGGARSLEKVLLVPHHISLSLYQQLLLHSEWDRLERVRGLRNAKDELACDEDKYGEGKVTPLALRMDSSEKGVDEEGRKHTWTAPVDDQFSIVEAFSLEQFHSICLVFDPWSIHESQPFYFHEFEAAVEGFELPSLGISLSTSLRSQETPQTMKVESVFRQRSGAPMTQLTERGSPLYLQPSVSIFKYLKCLLRELDSPCFASAPVAKGWRGKPTSSAADLLVRFFAAFGRVLHLE